MTDFRNLQIRRNGLLERVRMECGSYRVAFQCSVFAGLRLADAQKLSKGFFERELRDSNAEYRQRVGSLERLYDDAGPMGMAWTVRELIDEAQDQNGAWLRARGVSGESVNKMMRS